jgi:hypothetical protein
VELRVWGGRAAVRAFASFGLVVLFVSFVMSAFTSAFVSAFVAGPDSLEASEGRQRSKAVEDAVIEISGEKNPEQLPEYLVWKIGLRALAAIKKQNIAPALEELGLSDAEGEVVFAEGRAQQERDKECFERQERLTTMLRAAEAKPERIVSETRAIVIECRWATLDARDRMLAALTPDAQTAVVAWVLNQRRQINVTVHRADLEFFRQPR